MNSVIPSTLRYSLILIVSVLFVSGCSSSSDANSGESQMAADAGGSNVNGMASDGMATDDGTDDGTDGVANEMADTTTSGGSGAVDESTDGTEESTTGSEIDPVTDSVEASTPIAGTNPLGSEALESTQVNLELVADSTFRITWQPSTGALFSRVLENPDGISGYTQISDDLGASITSYDHRAALFARVNAQYLVQSCNDEGCVDSEPVMVAGTLESAIGYFKASNTTIGDEFGNAIGLSADGNTLAVGAKEENSLEDNSDHGSGAVYVFVRNGESWQQQAYLKASNSERMDNFGSDVSLSADGNTLAIGAEAEDSGSTGVNGDQNDNSIRNSGAVYVFVRNAEQWQQQTYFKASNTGSSDLFGDKVSLSADGNTLAIGAVGEANAATGINSDQDDSSALASGAVYVFIRIDESWQQQAYLKASNTGTSAKFGADVSLSTDGNTLAVGAREERSGTTGINGNQNDNSVLGSGAAYVFVRIGESWQQQAYLKASNTGDADLFGGAVSLSADGNTLAVGAEGEDSGATGINGDQNDNFATSSGAVYVFVRNDELWIQQAYLKASNADEEDFFGRAVSLSADGNTLVVGAEGEDSGVTGINADQNDNSGDFTGAVYVFVRSSETWRQQAYVKASNTEDNDNFGGAVSLSAAGNALAVGAIFEDGGATGVNGDQNDNTAGASGAVYLY